jgi:hypothetical protein
LLLLLLLPPPGLLVRTSSWWWSSTLLSFATAHPSAATTIFSQQTILFCGCCLHQSCWCALHPGGGKGHHLPLATLYPAADLSSTIIRPAAAAAGAAARPAGARFILMHSFVLAIAQPAAASRLSNKRLLVSSSTLHPAAAAAAAAAASFRPAGARFILVVEKDAIFQRLVEDRLFEALPCVLITGRGMPDIASRWALAPSWQQSGGVL